MALNKETVLKLDNRAPSNIPVQTSIIHKIIQAKYEPLHNQALYDIRPSGGGSTIIKIDVTSSDNAHLDFLNSYIMFNIKALKADGTNSETADLTLTSNLIERVKITHKTSGAIIEDIDNVGVLGTAITSLYFSRDYARSHGWKYSYIPEDIDSNGPVIRKKMLENGSQYVMMIPSGFLHSEKWISLTYCPLRIEITLSKAIKEVFIDSAAAADQVVSYQLTDVVYLATLVYFPDSVNNMYQEAYIRSEKVVGGDNDGNSLVSKRGISYNFNGYNVSQTGIELGTQTRSIHVPCDLASVNQIFVLFRDNDNIHDNVKDSFALTDGSGDGGNVEDDCGLESIQMKIGDTLFPAYGPIILDAQHKMEAYNTTRSMLYDLHRLEYDSLLTLKNWGGYVNGVYTPGTADRFIIGFNVDNSRETTESGLNIQSNELSIKLRFKAKLAKSITVYTVLVYDGEVHVAPNMARVLK